MHLQRPAAPEDAQSGQLLLRPQVQQTEGGANPRSDATLSRQKCVKILLRVVQLEQQLAGRQGSGKKTMERKNSLPGRSPQGKLPRSSPLKGTGGLTRLSIKPSVTADGPVTRSSKIVQDLELMFNSNKVISNGLLTLVHKRVPQ